jgi:hypothetical protein
MRIAQQILDRHVGRDDLTPGQRDYVAALAHFAAWPPKFSTASAA